MKRTPRKPSNLSEALYRQLNSYALAATAAGVGLLALSQQAEGRIVYYRTHYRFYLGFGSYSLDLNHDGIADFIFLSSTGIVFSYFGIRPAKSQSQNLIWGYAGPVFRTSFASALKAGVKVHASKKLGKGEHIMVFSQAGTPSWRCYGQWCRARNRYLGLKFYDVKGKAHYGWARLTNEQGTTRTRTRTLTGYAYETIPNKPIVAGKTHGKDVIAVQDASLGHLARGASAIPAWREKEAIGTR
jgi:hypothetical protein